VRSEQAVSLQELADMLEAIEEIREYTEGIAWRSWPKLRRE